MSLRELPPEQSEPPRQTLRGKLRFVPLVVLVVLSLIATVVGWGVRDANDQRARNVAANTQPAPLTQRTGVAAALPADCRPPVTPPAQELWLTKPAQAQAVWDANYPPIAKDPFLTGQDGWVFWNDQEASNFSQAVGRRILSRAEVATWRTYLTTMRDDLAAKGIPFYIVVTPANWDVYPQELPVWASGIRGSGPLDQLLAAAPDLPLVDVRAQLRAASVENPVFSRLNSHWTDYGALVAWNSIASCIRQATPAMSALAPLATTGVTIGPAHNEYAPYGLVDENRDWTLPSYSTPLKPVSVSDSSGNVTTVEGEQATDLALLPVSTQTSGAQVDKTLLILRDSFGGGLSIPLQQSFARTEQVRHNFDYPANTRPRIADLVSKDHPDIVILQLAERYLTFPPATAP